MDMNRKRLSRILGKSSAETLKALVEPVMGEMDVNILKKPAKTMVMVRMKETVEKADFYIGELLASEAMVEIAGVKGFALMAGDHMDKVLYAAVIDAVVQFNNEFQGVIMRALQEQEELIRLREQREIRLHQATKVKFETMNVE